MRRRYWVGIILIIIGLWIWLSYLGVPYIAFNKNWPLILVFFGFYIIIRRMTKSSYWVRRSQVISDLEQGKITVDEAIEKLRRRK